MEDSYQENVVNKNVMQFFDRWSRDVLGDGNYLHPRMENYLLNLEKKLEGGHISESAGNARINPSFFQEHYKLSLKIFPTLVSIIREYSNTNFIVRSGDYDLHILGRTNFFGAWINRKGKSILDDNGIDFPAHYVAKKFVHRVGRKGLDKMILNDLPDYVIKPMLNIIW